ncbi:MAG: FHA domain-containing protein [Propionibacteriaceae bacterium]|nr:FHA domain-containing protein [Propionibacteriaceae bacterium]
MAAFTVLVLKIAFLAILWLFIVLIAAVVNSDMVGRRQKRHRGTPPAPLPAGETTPSAPPPAAPKPHKRGKREPWVLAMDSGLHAGDRLQLVPEVRIGRSEACELVLDDDYVSSMHAQLSHQGDGTWVLKDLGSTNGTFVNSQRITDPTVVGTQDVIRIGNVQMRLET